MRYSTEYEQAIKEAGFVVQERINGKHIKLFATHPSTGAQRHRIMLPRSPSDFRGVMKFRSDLKHLLRDNAA